MSSTSSDLPAPSPVTRVAPRSVFVSLVGAGLILIGLGFLPVSLFAGFYLWGQFETGISRLETSRQLIFVLWSVMPFMAAVTGIGLLLRWRWARYTFLAGLGAAVIATAWAMTRESSPESALEQQAMAFEDLEVPVSTGPQVRWSLLW